MKKIKGVKCWASSILVIGTTLFIFKLLLDRSRIRIITINTGSSSAEMIFKRNTTIYPEDSIVNITKNRMMPKCDDNLCNILNYNPLITFNRKQTYNGSLE